MYIYIYIYIHIPSHYPPPPQEGLGTLPPTTPKGWASPAFLLVGVGSWPSPGPRIICIYIYTQSIYTYV